MASSLSIGVRQSATTKLTPAQLQAVRMLEIPSCELMERINEELQANPALDEGAEISTDTLEDTLGEEGSGEEETSDRSDHDDEFGYDDYAADDEKDDYSTHDTQTESYAGIMENTYTSGESFSDYIWSQVGMTDLSEQDRQVALFVVGNMNDYGFLPRTIEELVDDLSFREAITVSDDRMRDIVTRIQHLDPPGVATYNLRECLTIQLERKDSTPAVQIARHIVTTDDLFEDFSQHRYQRIQQRLELTDDQLRDAIAVIAHLNPYPSYGWQDTGGAAHVVDTVIPDFIIDMQDGIPVVSLNQPDVPELRITPEYRDMLTAYKASKQSLSSSDKAAMSFVKKNIEAADWFIEAIRQRNETMMQVMKTIVALQYDYFLTGDESTLHPMMLKDVAERSGYDVSTISRVSNNKYAQTEYGILPLRFFFVETVANRHGEEISNRRVKQLLRELIDNEDKTNPLTDDEIQQQLKQQGFDMARRTIAKYRDMLSIPVARLRRQM